MNSEDDDEDADEINKNNSISAPGIFYFQINIIIVYIYEKYSTGKAIIIFICSFDRSIAYDKWTH